MSEISKKLADEHWSYVGELLELHEIPDSVIDLLEWHYKTAMIHSYKHGKEAANVDM